MLDGLCDVNDSNKKRTVSSIVLVLAKSFFKANVSDIKKSRKGDMPKIRMMCVHLLIRDLELSIRDVCNIWEMEKGSVHRFLKNMDGIMDLPMADHETHEKYVAFRDKVIIYINTQDGIIK